MLLCHPQQATVDDCSHFLLAKLVKLLGSCLEDFYSTIKPAGVEEQRSSVDYEFMTCLLRDRCCIKGGFASNSESASNLS